MTEPTARPAPASASVCVGELLTVEELSRRLRWKRHSTRQAKRLGLPVHRFGSRDYCIGDEVLLWFRTIGQQQEAQP